VGPTLAKWSCGPRSKGWTHARQVELGSRSKGWDPLIAGCRWGRSLW
jgi:hypothetical protein